MIQIKPKKLKATKDNVAILDFTDFDYLDVVTDEKLSKKDLGSFLEYKVSQEFGLDLDDYDCFYIKGNRANAYQVYSVDKKIFSVKKNNILVPKSLAYSSLGGDYYVLIIGEKSSCIMLYIDGIFILSNDISFIASDLHDTKRVESLIVFIKDIVEHICKDTPKYELVNALYIQVSDEYKDLISNDIDHIKSIFNFKNISLLSDDVFYSSININLFNGRMFYSIYPALFSYLLVSSLCIVGIFVGYLFLSFQNGLVQSDIKSLYSFYDQTNGDVKKYYVLHDKLQDLQNDLTTYKLDIAKLSNQNRAFDLTSVLVNVLRTVNDYGVYLQSVEIKSEYSRRWVYVDVIFKDKSKIQRYINSSPNYLIEQIGRDKDMFVYRVKAEVK